ncbi:MAG: TIGR02757 family protein [Planctomycetes bacterium]|nr:TIGR02757 family protein [Planctomycetota bacterium]
MPLRKHAGSLEELYLRYNHRRYVHPDPLEFLYGYDDPADVEVAGLIAAGLAYGRVRQILASVRKALDRLGPNPAGFVRKTSTGRFEKTFADFKHRFTTGRQMAGLLAGIKKTLADHGSLEACFAGELRAGGESDVMAGLSGLVDRLDKPAGGLVRQFLSDPVRGSACKRLHMFLRWMIRSDGVDPGTWRTASPSALLVPLDTHMFRLARALGATARTAADLRAAREITAAFAAVQPDDPVKYDFCLTRIGIRGEPPPQFIAELPAQPKKRTKRIVEPD